MEAAGIEVATTKVGDRYVIEELRARGGASAASSPATSSTSDFAATGDGSPLRCWRCGRSADADVGRPAPMASCRSAGNVAARPEPSAAPPTSQAIERETDRLAGRGRLVVRVSGTEPLIRVMVEAPSPG